ncbi:MAG TPA: hypothetical protein VGI79_05115 [Caulobacteraceae bacterium]
MRSAARLAKAQLIAFRSHPFQIRGPAMLAIGMIAAFILVILGLNFLEFGRGD